MRVMIEVNVSNELLESVASVLPCMREITVAPLQGGDAVALKAAVPRTSLPGLISVLKEKGGTDIVVFEPAFIIP